VSFNDHIDHYNPSEFDFAAANKFITSLVARMFLILDMALITKDHGPLTEWASQYRSVVRRLIRDAIQAERFKLKIAMLKDSSWRLRVMRDLGGLRAFVNWHKRRKTGEKLVL